MKRVLSLFLALVLVLSALPVGVIAESQTTAQKNTLYTEPLAQHAHAASGDAHICEHCVAAGKTGADAVPAWQAWSSTNTKLPDSPGHYYLTGDMTVTSADLNAEEAVICLNGYTVTAKSGHRFYTLKNSAKLTILDCTAKTVSPENAEDTGYRAGKLTGATSCGFMYEYNSANASEIYWYDGILSNVSRSDSGGAFCVQGASKLHIYGGEFTDCSATKSGGLIYLGSSKCSLVAENATFLRNQAVKGGVIFSNYGTAELKACSFDDNVVSTHGAAYAGTGGSLVAADCSFTGNTAANFGVICGEGSGIKITLDSCRITENTVTNDNGAVYVPNSGCQLNLKGSIYIYGNTRKDGKPGNIHLQNDGNGNYSVVNVSELSAEAKIGINVAAARLEKTKVLSKALSGSLTRAQVFEYFYSDDSAYMIDLADDKLVLAEGHVHTAHLTTCTDSGCTGHENLQYLPWTDPNSLPTSGNYYLDVDVTTKTQPKLTTGTLNLCLNGKTVTIVQRFDISGDAVANITDCSAEPGTITGATGTVFYMTGDASKKSYVNFYNGIITGCNRSTFHASVAYLQSGATLNMYGGEITGNTVGGNGTNDYGGTIYLNNAKGTFNMYGGKITGNTAVKASGKGGNGAAVFSNGGTVNILGGEISGNTAAGYGGAIWAKGGKVTVQNATISGNTAAYGSAILGAGGGVQIILDNAAITGNKATGNFGAVYIPNNGAKITVSGNTKVTGNQGGDLFLVKDSNTTSPNHPMVTLGAAGIGENAKIAITMRQDRIDVEPHASLALGGKLTEEQAAKHFYSSDTDYEVVLKNDRLLLEKSASAHSHCVCGVSGCTDHAQIACKPWTDPNSLPTSGSYYLEVDVTTKTQPKLTTGTLDMCLNGKTITIVQRFDISGDAVLNITDCRAEPGKITGATGTVFYMTGDASKKSYVNFYNGIVTDCERLTFHASVAYIQNGATFTMYGGEITGNTVGGNGTDDFGGTIYLNNAKGTFTMYGGKITGNKSVKTGGKGGNGAAIFSNGGTVNILGGEISNNTAEGQGGAIWAKGGKVAVQNATISGNTATHGSAILGAGGGVQITLDNAVITGNQVTRDYGAVYIPNNGAKITVSGNTKVTDNQGGDLFLVKDSNTTSPNHPMVTLGAAGIGEDARIGITMRQNRMDVEPYASQVLGGKLTEDQVKQYFFCSDENYEVVLKEDRLLVQPLGGYHIHCVCGDAECTEHTQVEYKAWNDSASLPTEGNWYLNTDVTITKEVTIKKDLSLCLNGHKVTGRTSSSRFYSTNGTSNEVLTISDCTAKLEDGVYTAGGFYNNTYTHSVAGGAIFTRPNSTLHFYDGIISGCTAYGGGGAIYGNKGSSINIYNGKFIDNAAKEGDTWKNGGVIYLLDAQLTIYGGQFTGNQGNIGSVVYTSGQCTVDIRGGSFSGNIAHKHGAILAPANGSLTFGGAPVITGNTKASGGASNVHLGNVVMELENLDASARIAVTAPAFSAISTKTLDYTENFLSDDPMVYIVYQDQVLYTLSNSDHKHCICAATTTQGCEHSTLTFAPWNDPTAMPTSGNYYLEVDVTVASQASLANTTLNLCLNGHTVTVGKQGGRVYKMFTGAKLSITDCAGGGKLSGATQGILLSDASGTNMELNLYNGILTENHGKATGGALVVQGGCVFNMYGGKITGNSVSNYLTLDADGNPKLDENGNQIPVTTHAGGVYLGAGATFNMYGGEISNNTVHSVEYLKAGATTPTTSTPAGGGVYITESVANLYGGKICGNRSTWGGGVHVRGYKGVLNLHGVEISGNYASSGGGIISLTGAVTNMTSGSVKNNHATGSAGGFYVSSKTTFNMSGGIFTGNTTDGNGGAIYFLSATGDLTGGTVTGNAAKGNGGGIGTSGDGNKITISDFEISKNTAKNGGGMIIQSQTTLEMRSGKITGNKVSAQGGGLFASTNSTFIMTGGSITGNTSTGAGGGVCLLRCKSVNLKGGEISYNTASEAGALKVQGSKVTISGGSMVGNRAIGTLDKKTGKYSGGNGGAVVIGRAGYKQNGVSMTEFPVVTIYSTYIAYNKSNAAAGGILVQSDGTTFSMYGGTIAYNESPSDGGGAYFSTKSRPTVQNVTFYGNKAKNSGAFHVLNTTGTFSNIKCYNNQTTTSGAACVITGKETLIEMKNMEFYDNQATGAAGAFVVQGSATLNLDGAKIYGNISGSTAGAIYFSAPGYGTLKNIEVYENKAKDAGGIYIGNGSEVTIEDATIRDNVSVGTYGGGVYNRGRVDLKNVKILNNQVTENGGGLAGFKTASRYTGQNAGIYAENCVISGNAAGMQGGGVYNQRGCPTYLTNCTITDNTAGAEGGAIYSDGRFGMIDTTVTGNTSGGEGYAVYITAAEYDGHSYSTGHKKFGGNIIIKDNQGGGLYLSEGSTVAIVNGPLGEKSHIEVTLHSGVLTNHLFGVYDYEGGDLVYTVTAGDRSLTEPEDVDWGTEDSDQQTKKTATGDIWLYAGIGIVALAVIVAVVLVIKKKAGKTAEKANNE